MEKEFVVFDVETTGFKATQHEIIQLAYTKLEPKELEIIDKGSFYFRPKHEVPMEIQQLTGITNQILKKKGVDINTMQDVVKSIFHDCIAVGHNVKFDLGFLAAHFNISPRFFIDTLFMAKIKAPNLKNHKLETVARFANVDLDNAHNAFYDTLATAEILQYFHRNGIDIYEFLNITTKADYQRIHGKK